MTLRGKTGEKKGGEPLLTCTNFQIAIAHFYVYRQVDKEAQRVSSFKREPYRRGSKKMDWD